MGATTSPAAVAATAAIRNILFATDFSPCSEAALPFAVDLARRHHAALFATHVLAPEPRYELPLEREADEMNVAKQEANRALDELLQRKELADIVHAGILRTGEFWHVIEDIVTEREIDFMVAGTHGRAGLRKMFLGSTAEIIFRNARCPVLTVGPHVKPDQSGAPRVLFATDFSETSLKALPYAIWAAEQQGGTLTLFRVISPTPMPVEAIVLPVIEPQMVEDARMELLPLLKEVPRSVHVDLAAMLGPTAETILEMARQSNASLIVLGVRHKGVLGTHSPWSISDNVVAMAPCPVLTVRGDLLGHSGR